MISENKELITLSDTLYLWGNENFYHNSGSFLILGVSFILLVYQMSMSLKLFLWMVKLDRAGIADGSALSSLSSLAGIDLPNTKGMSSINEGIERMKSRDFIKSFIKKYGYLDDIILAEDWDSSKNEYKYNYEFFDRKSMKWDPYVLSWNENEPYEVAYKKLVEEIDIKYNFRDRVYSITYRNFSPFMAQELLQNLIKEIDNTQRDIDIKDFKAKKSI